MKYKKCVDCGSVGHVENYVCFFCGSNNLVEMEEEK